MAFAEDAASEQLQGGLGTCNGSRLLDLPTELLFACLHDAPHTLRSTCRALRDILDGVCRSLRLSRSTRASRHLADLSSLLQRLPQLQLLACHKYDDHCHLNPAITARHLQTVSSQLTALDLSHCELTDVGLILSTLPSLRALNLTNCATLQTLDPIKQCPQLTSLTLTHSLGHRVDLGPLSSLHSLASLDVHSYSWSGGPELLDLDPLHACPSLTSLDLAGTLVADLSALWCCPRLTALQVDCSNSVIDITPLAASAASLTHLSFTGSGRITHLAPLAAAASLTSLALAFLVHLVDLSPLAGCVSLTSLRLLQCVAVADISPLVHLRRSLTLLSLEGCLRVTFVDAVAACTSLIHCDLQYTAVTSLLPLVACTRLAVLKLAATHLPPRWRGNSVAVALAWQQGKRTLQAVHGPRLCIEDVTLDID